ncbi:MAG TPA: hypothetical protein PKX93_08910, partial [bacterium]|nr:hypothetical protein [bacterium]
MRLQDLKILRIQVLAGEHFWIEMENRLSSEVLPGQFVHIKISPFLFLRRPFSVASVSQGRLGFLIRCAGTGTALLSEKIPGQRLSVLGPLGTGFPVRKRWKKLWLVAGGTGVASLLLLLSLLQKLKEKEIVFFYGAVSKSLLFRQLLPPGNYLRIFTTDDGTSGQAGSVTEPVRKRLITGEKPDVLYGSGPLAMLKELSLLCKQYDVTGYLSLEARLACGTGICLGCVVPIGDANNWSYQRVCCDGPVFP